ncbi:MAG: DNA-protecting protein DprA [Planctomyces sp.]|nr:DNA-protecting protein DprA [Planctomyces sp.]
MSHHTQHTHQILRLCAAPGWGPVLIARAIATLGSPGAVLDAPAERLRTVPGVGAERAKAMVDSRPTSGRAADGELERAAAAGAQLVAFGSTDYPPLLAQIPDPPPVLYVRGSWDPARLDRYPIAVVGSRRSTAYGIEQTERFAHALASAGLAVISGGARGIDGAAHRAALRAKGRTLVVLGCGVDRAYPDEHADLFAKVLELGGAIVSELPMGTPPVADNFPARNRIISGMALGVLVIEAGEGSGSLITAQQAAEEHGREVFALPGRVDSPTSAGCLRLIRSGGAVLTISPADILDALAEPARHHFYGTHAARYAPIPTPDAHPTPPPNPPQPPQPPQPERPATHQAILAALTEPRTLDQLAQATGLEPGALRATLTILELQRLIARQGTRVIRQLHG